ncbi:MAG TPA: DUF4831 family protein [Bacteroidales bacterium]|nr:DUF4831 family protein [Bacteroidales bacterium]HPT10587.1 DUF4831 family protein [Bacteroidales bacterium]
MNRFRWILAFVLLFSAYRGLAQINVFHIDNTTTPQTKEGIFYALPRTVVKIEVRIDRIENYKGPYSDYALRLLGLKNVVAANSIDYKISEILITTYPEPDPGQYYFIEMDNKIPKGEKEGLFSLTEAGLFLGTLPSAVEETTGVSAIPKSAEETDLDKDAFGELFKYSADVSVFEKVDTIIRKINIDTMTVERQYYKRTMVEKSPEQKAKEAADFISKIKENRFQLISGFQEVNYNRETLEYMDTQLKTMEKEYLKLFTGISIHKPTTFEYKYIPLPNQINTEIPIFKFSKSSGIIDLDSKGGKVVTIRIQRVGNTNMVAAYLDRAEKELKEHGLSYRIPELARVTVKIDEENQEETQCLINQLGVITYLPVNKWKVQYHQQTGGIKGVEIR